MSEHDLYAVLKLERTAERIEVVRAYRRLMRKYHPDTRASGHWTENKAGDRQLQLVMEAYAVLADPVRRAEYDQRTQPRSGASRDLVRPVPNRPHAQDSAAFFRFYDVPPEETTWLLPPAGFRYRRMAALEELIFRWLQQR